MDKQWLVNYYKSLRTFADSKLFELAAEGLVPHENPIENFLLKHESKIKSGKRRRHTEADKKSTLIKFSDLLHHIGSQSTKIYEESESTLKSYRYVLRVPRPEQAKKFIKLTNGALIFESFFNEVNEIGNHEKR